MPSPNVNPWAGNYYSARGTAINRPATNPDRYATTGLIHNGGATAATGLAAMVGGDVNQDLMINAADRVRVRLDEGTQSYQSDITGDRYVNAVDRTITDKNFGKVSSLMNVVIPPVVPLAPPNPFNAIAEEAPELSNYFNVMAERSAVEKPSATVNTKKVKKGDKFLALTYEVSAEAVYNDSGYVDLSMYIRNLGDEFAPANCTFAVGFDSEQLEYLKLLGADSVIFNSTFDYNNLNDETLPATSYLKLNSAPNASNKEGYKNIRTIEVDYDAFANIGGINVPLTKTYLGTLRFKTTSKTSIVKFTWHESKAVITTTGSNVTDDGK